MSREDKKTLQLSYLSTLWKRTHGEEEETRLPRFPRPSSFSLFRYLNYREMKSSFQFANVVAPCSPPVMCVGEDPNWEGFYMSVLLYEAIFSPLLNLGWVNFCDGILNTVLSVRIKPKMHLIIIYY